MVEPLSVGVHAVRRAGVSPGKTVAIMGAGPIGEATHLSTAVQLYHSKFRRASQQRPPHISLPLPLAVRGTLRNAESKLNAETHRKRLQAQFCAFQCKTAWCAVGPEGKLCAEVAKSALQAW